MGSYAIIQLLFGLCSIAVGVFGLFKMLTSDATGRSATKVAINFVAVILGAYLAIEGYSSL